MCVNPKTPQCTVEYTTLTLYCGSTMNNEQQQIENAYSYVRLSSKGQTFKSGAERQLSKPEQICKEMGWKLCNQSFQDLGVSGWKGDNIFKGALSEFIALNKQKKLLPNAVLLIEQWDRISRQNLIESESVVLDLLKSGIAIYVSFSRQLFTKQSCNSLPDRIAIMLSLQQAHDYSENLSKRIKHAKQAKIQKVLDGKIIDITDLAPSYFKWNGKEYEENDNSWKVKRMFSMYLNNIAITKIVKTFNIEKVKTFYKTPHWSNETIKCVLTNRAVLGEYRGKLVFPKLVSNEDFDKVQMLLERNKKRRGHESPNVNLFRGLLYCSKCGAKVYPSFTKPVTYRYFCKNAREGNCDQTRSIVAWKLELALFVELIGKRPELMIDDNSSRIETDIAILENKKSVLQKKINKLILIEEEMTDIDLKLQFNAFKEQKAELDKQIFELKNTAQQVSSNSIEDIRSLLTSIEGWKKWDNEIDKVLTTLKDLEIRKKIAMAIPNVIKRIDLMVNNRTMKVTFINGKQIDHDFSIPLVKKIVDELPSDE